MGAGAVTRFPLFNAFFFTHVQAKLFSAEVRAGDSGDAVSIAEAKINERPQTVHLGSTYCSIFIGITRENADTINSYEGEDAGTADVRSRNGVAAGAGRLCANVSAQVEGVIMGAGALTMFPLLNAVVPTNVKFLIFCTSVRSRHGVAAGFVGISAG